MKLFDFKAYSTIFLFTGLLVVYLATLCPTVYVGDSGELAAAAHALGIPHASGYPLYSLIGKMFCLFPIGNIAFRMNLMSAAFIVLAVWLVHSIILKISGSGAAAFCGSFVMAFVPVVWWQSVAAEVYSLHMFFAAMLIRLLLWWDDSKDFYRLLVFVFVVGLSFGNHLQTVMLAPVVLFLIISGDRKALFNGKRFLLVSLFFVTPLLIYLYLPIRTWAGAAMHWGDPDNLERFLTHVTGRAHRAGYVFNLGAWEYWARAKESLWILASQFGMMIVPALWGWIKLDSLRWRLFFLLVVAFDVFYTVFLNTVSLEITPFNLSAYIVLGILAGNGIADALRGVEGLTFAGPGVRRAAQGACCFIPLVFLVSNFSLVDQRRNYTAHEHALNILRTVGNGAVLFMSGDNYIFPLTYARLVDRAREDVVLSDSHNVIFKTPHMVPEVFRRKDKDVFYAMYGPDATGIPEDASLIPYGVVFKMVGKEAEIDQAEREGLWNYYSVESFYDQFERDFMTREICAYYYFNRGKSLILSGQTSQGFGYLQKASEMGYNNTLIHSDMGVFLTDLGFYDEAHKALVKSLQYHEDLAAVHNNWGYYYHKTGNLDKAIESFTRALELKPDKDTFLNNLAFALLKKGSTEEALQVFERSLALNENQPKIEKLIKRKTTLKKGNDQ